MCSSAVICALVRPWATRVTSSHSRALSVLGPGADRGAAMSLATAAEYALMLTDPEPPPPAAPGPGR